MGTIEQCTDSSHSPSSQMSVIIFEYNMCVCAPFALDSMRIFLYPQLLCFSAGCALSRA